jgi:hypothetical protein
MRLETRITSRTAVSSREVKSPDTTLSVSENSASIFLIRSCKAKLFRDLAAEWLGISRATLSGYLANGRIEPYSLAGEGARACLDINRAVADLRRNLDPEQLERANRRVRLRFFHG